MSKQHNSHHKPAATTPAAGDNKSSVTADSPTGEMPRLDVTRPGGRYVVYGEVVDCHGKPVRGPETDE
ncbi:MAG: hypothetical protein U0Z53_29060 [Blastocatellia bacterium]